MVSISSKAKILNSTYTVQCLNIYDGLEQLLNNKI